jgi:hypothetical protein
MALIDNEENKRNFLQQLFTATNGDAAGQVSMYDIGNTLGLERNEASRIAEDLIASDLIEIRTLAGAVGIHPEAISEIRQMINADDTDSPGNIGLGRETVLSDSAKAFVIELAGDMKTQIGSLGLDFEVLSETMADLKTIDAQLESPRPKTAIVRECLVSLSDNFSQSNATALSKRVSRALEV